MNDLKNWRQAKGLTQSEMAEKLSTNQKSYSAYETGRTAVPGGIQSKLRKMGFTSAFPHEAKPETETQVTREDLARGLGRLEGRIERLETLVERLGEALRALALKVPGSHHE